MQVELTLQSRSKSIKRLGNHLRIIEKRQPWNSSDPFNHLLARRNKKPTKLVLPWHLHWCSPLMKIPFVFFAKPNLLQWRDNCIYNADGSKYELANPWCDFHVIISLNRNTALVPLGVSFRKPVGCWVTCYLGCFFFIHPKDVEEIVPIT